MAKNDIQASLLSGLLFSILILFLSFTLELKIPYLWAGIFVFPLLAVIGIYIAFQIGNKIPVFFQLTKFLVVGTLNTLMDIGVLNLLIFTSGIAAGPWFSVFKALGFMGALFNSYLWNKTWTFKAKPLFEGDKKEFLAFAAIAAVGFFLNVGIATFIVNGIGPQFGLSAKLWASVGALTATAAVFTWNFIGFKVIVFKK